MHRPAKSEDLNYVPVRQGRCELARARRRTAGPDSKFGERLVHREHRAEPADHARHRLRPDRVE